MTTASKVVQVGLAGALLALVPALAHGNQAQNQRDVRAQMNYIGWQQSQAAAVYVYTAEDAARDQIRANIEAAQRAKVRKDATRDWWGVVVVSTEDGAWNVKLNGEDKTIPLMDAMDGCKGVCSPILSFANSCIAPAYSEQGGMYWEQGETREKAREAATSACNAAGGSNCNSPNEQAMCTGWKYAYSGLERFSHRMERTAKGDIASPKFEYFPGAQDYIAKPLERRGTSTAKIDLKKDYDSSVPWAKENLDRRAQGVMRMAEPWTAIAAGSGPKAYAIHWGLNETDAKDTAISKCGGGDCRVLAAVPYGKCLTAIRLHKPDGRVDSFGGQGATQAEAEEIAMTRCISSGAVTCPVVFNECMKKK